MEDIAGKISNQAWQWYKKCRDMEKGDKEWNGLIDEANAIVQQYKGDKDNERFAKDMLLLFIDRVETLERNRY